MYFCTSGCTFPVSDKRNVWLQDLATEQREAPVLLPLVWQSDILLIKWMTTISAAVLTEDGMVHKLHSTFRDVLISYMLPFDHQSLRPVDFVEAGGWSARCSVRFEVNQNG
jgi:hypothetical protein